jgi:hypothetical protein
MIKNITAAYVALIGIFGILLVIGSIKTTMYPDELVYTPGKIVTVYDPESQTFAQIAPWSTENHYEKSWFQANSIHNKNTVKLTNCDES